MCKTENEGKEFHLGATSSADLPWYNALPSAHTSSPIVVLMGLALGTLIGAAVLLKMVLHVVERSSIKRRTQPSGSLELPPRLLTLARKTQGRKPDGLGVLGLKQRVSSRTLTQVRAVARLSPASCSPAALARARTPLTPACAPPSSVTQLAFPLMSREHAIAEADEEAMLGWQSPTAPGAAAAFDQLRERHAAAAAAVNAAATRAEPSASSAAPSGAASSSGGGASGGGADEGGGAGAGSSTLGALFGVGSRTRSVGK